MKFYITTAIAYVNAPPHMGHALQFVRTDAMARYRKLKGADVFFLTGTDEYGSKVYKTAKKEKITPQKLTNKNTDAFKKLDELLNISYDEFIRTTDKKKHWPGAQLIWKKLSENDDLYKEKYKGYYCNGCEAYLTKKELRGGKCVYHNTEPEYLEEENYFFKLSKYSSRLKKIIESGELKITPASRKNEALNLVKDGLKDISFSRPQKTLPWGIPVPDDPEHVMYVWCDALANYISALGYGSDNLEKFNKFWPADIHVIGKDNLRFHTLYWPAMLLSAGLPLPKEIYIHGFITSGGRKMSKSMGNTIDPFEVAKKYGTDALRYYLLKAIPAIEDGDFTIKHFEEVYNADLANGLGNTLARVVAMAEKYASDMEHGTHNMPARRSLGEGGEHANEWREIIDTSKECVEYAMKDYDTTKAVMGIWHILKKIDEDIDNTKPWTLNKDDKQLKILNSYLYNWLEALRNVGNLLKPFLPETSDKISERLGFDEKEKQFNVKKGDSLFPRI